ncbi:pentatricopeptide repeat-containing protein At5g66520-like [Nymphaea colorata]|uniref:DYW domain-containing protein n=1 Tax=Nymphaea colorata TaxID=210225 RepID=A0A5K1DXL9_9MAGN|nr:pentatricopeptide repeat-containing protein At5g66520-like [Nymphaea colorata]
MEATQVCVSSIPSPSSRAPTRTILSILGSNSLSLYQIKQIHAQILRRGLADDNHFISALAKRCAECSLCSLGYALQVFDQTTRPNAFIWNAVIRGCLHKDAPREAIFLYYKMVAQDYVPNKYTLPIVFKACCVAGAVEEGEQIHTHVLKLGLWRDGHIQSAAIQMYASCRRVREARRLLDQCPESDVVSWNAMIDGYLKQGELEAAKELFEQMPCSRSTGSWNAMISGYAKCGMIESARELFDDIPEKDDVSWSAMIDGYVQNGLFERALEVFQQMQNKGIPPSRFVLPSVLSACANLGALDQGRWVHAYVERNSMQLDAVGWTALVDMYAKCGCLPMALQVFENITRKEVFTWNALIHGLAMHGHADAATKMFLRMQNEKITPDGITFLGVLNACAHAGLVEEGFHYFNTMKRNYKIKPTIEHYGCMVDLLGRAGRLDEAEDFISSMPIKANASVWGALLGACRIHGNVELGGKVGKILLELEPENSGRYALLSNIYAAAGRWDDVSMVRKLMKDRGIKTVPGYSLIHLNGMIHKFVTGDGSHPQKKEIYLMLDDILKKLKLAGHLPIASQVLLDMEEEEKESALCYHSEKLAIAFAILSTAPGTPIRIAKNLRVCEDCHSATKLISHVYKREIIVRDRVRYHCFRDGRCTCKDFW